MLLWRRIAQQLADQRTLSLQAPPAASYGANRTNDHRFIRAHTSTPAHRQLVDVTPLHQMHQAGLTAASGQVERIDSAHDQSVVETSVPLLIQHGHPLFDTFTSKRCSPDRERARRSTRVISVVTVFGVDLAREFPDLRPATG